MEAEFERAERIRDKQRREADRQRKLREEQDARGRKIIEEAEKKRQGIIQAQRDRDVKRREREEEEALSTGGIHYTAFLKPRPLANLETDRVRLPPSALETLINAGAIGDTAGKVLTFELSLFDDAAEKVISKTHCGVLEFTAEEGTVEVPVKAAVSLGKELGDSALTSWRLRVRYVAIDRYEKIRARIQPLGKGFHIDGSDTANIDLKSVLERVLSKQTTITEGDWIPLRHEGKTYTLAVRELWPDQQAVLLNTDVEIDLMPSEEVMKEKEAEEREKRAKQARTERAKKLAESLPAEPSAGGIVIKARFPDSLVGSRKFNGDCKLAVLFDWADSLLGEKTPPSPHAKLEIVLSAIPGQSTVLDKEISGENTLRELGFARSENLNFRWRIVANENKMDVVSQEEEKQTDHVRTNSGSSEEWSAIRASAESRLDRDLLDDTASARESTTPVDEQQDGQHPDLSSAEMFKLLVSKGAEPQSAARACQRYLPTLRTLKNLSLLDQPNAGPKAVELVEKYKGSTGRVADAMIGATTDDITMAGAESEATSGNPSRPPSNGFSKWGEEIAILESMFTGRDRDELVHALEKHGGSVQKAVNELLS